MATVANELMENWQNMRHFNDSRLLYERRGIRRGILRGIRRGIRRGILRGIRIGIRSWVILGGIQGGSGGDRNLARRNLARSPIHHEGSGPRKESQPKEYDPSPFGSTPTRQSVPETDVATSNLAFPTSPTLGLDPGRNCGDETRTGG